MPIIKSAQKRVRTTKKATVRNLKTRRDYKNSVKSVETKLKSGAKTVSKELSAAYSDLDKAVKKGVITKNKAARKKAQLSESAKKSSAKPSAGKKKTKTTKKPTTKSKTKK